MQGQHTIKDFVQQTLGCTCPDKVFEQIEDREVAAVSSPHTRSITIGGRLLIYIWVVPAADNFKDNLLAMLAAGRKERDAQGLNRFRAVLAVAGPLQHVASEVESICAWNGDVDDRVHVHVIHAAALADI